MSEYESGYESSYGGGKKKRGIFGNPLVCGGIVAAVLLIGGGVAAALLLFGDSSVEMAGNDTTKLVDSGSENVGLVKIPDESTTSTTQRPKTTVKTTKRTTKRTTTTVRTTPPNVIKIGSTCYQLRKVKDGRRKSEAVRDCANVGGTVLDKVIKNNGNKQRLKELMRGFKVWTNIYDNNGYTVRLHNRIRDWSWGKGGPKFNVAATIYNWCEGEPNNADREQTWSEPCVIMRSDYQVPCMDDRRCENTERASAL